jgi:hypothetical protein
LRRIEFLDKLHSKAISTIFVPANCTPLLQPLDCEGSVNDEFKKEIKREFTSWYADKVKEAMDEGTDMADIEIDTRMSTLKPLHAGAGIPENQGEM